MPKKGEHTPITDYEAEEWVRRMTGSEEDFGMAGEEEEWMGYVASKFETERGYAPTEAQLNRLTSIRPAIADRAGYRTEYPFPTRPWDVRFRDAATGRFLSSDAVAWRFSAFKGWL